MSSLHFKCVCCGRALEWEEDTTRSDLKGTELPEDKNSVVARYHCPYCGTLYTIDYPSEEERRKYKLNNKKES